MSVQPGRYYGVVVSGSVVMSKQNNPQMSVGIELRHFAASESADWVALDAPLQRRLFLSFSEKAEEYTVKKLDAMGFNGSFTAPQFSGQAVEPGVVFTCELENDREKWDLLNWGGVAAAAPVDVVRRLEAKWKTLKGPAASPKPPAPSAPSSSVGGTALRNAAYTKVYLAWGEKAKTDAGAIEVQARFNAAIQKVCKNVGLNSPDEMTSAHWVSVVEDASVPF